MQILSLRRTVSSGTGDHSVSRGNALSEEGVRDQGFELFKTGTIRRLSPTHYVVKARSAAGWNLVELRDGIWICDCKSADAECAHLYAAQLHRSTSRPQPDQFDEAHLRCRYCGSVDVASSGYRFNARGIARRYRCNECLRKFSIPHVQTTKGTVPSEMAWILNEIGMLTTKLTDLLSELNMKLDTITTASGRVESEVN